MARSENEAEALKKFTNIVDVVNTIFPPKTILMLTGQKVTVPQFIAMVQGAIDAIRKRAATEAQLTEDRTAEHAARETATKAIEALDKFAETQFTANSVQLEELGVHGRKKGRMSAQAKAEAVAKRLASHEAAGPTGKQQRKEKIAQVKAGKVTPIKTGTGNGGNSGK